MDFTRSLSLVTLYQVPTSVNHQILFDTKDKQKSFFSKYIIKSWDNCSFTDRHSAIRIKGYNETLNANYLTFMNDKGRIMYCFITSHRYIAEQTIEINFTLDVIQTYMFDITFRNCFIERAMVSDDTIGKHTIQEDFALGDIITCKRQGTTALKPEHKPAFIMAVVSSSEGATRIGGIFSGLNFIYYDYNHTADLKNKINQYCKEGRGDEIAYIFTFPDYFKSDSYANGTLIGYEELQSYIEYLDLKNVSYFEGYKPFNNKLYTYPFSMVTISNNTGSNVVLKRELLEDTDKLKFKLDCLMSPGAVVTLTPCDYAGRQYSYDDSISMSDYPLCCWVNDTYSNWKAQHTNSLESQSQNALLSLKTGNKIANNNYNTANTLNKMSLGKNLFNTAVGGVTSLLGGNIAGGLTRMATGGVNAGIDYTMSGISDSNSYNNAMISNMSSYQAQVNSLMASIEDMKIQPNSCRGDTRSTGLEISRNNADFHIDVKSIRKEYAVIIDLYYQQFGYKLNSIENPKNYLHTREKWNYIKTLDCSVFGRDIPQDDIIIIQEIFNNGITFWHDDSNMKNYNQSNPII